MIEKKYTVMFIPDDEKSAKSYHFSKKSFLFILSCITSLAVSSVFIIIFFVPKIRDYYNLKNQNAKILSERMEVLNLSRDLNRIQQMDTFIRSSLGASVDFDNRPVVVDSVSGIFKKNINKVSHIENIPSLAPINGYVSQHSEQSGFFVKAAHNGIDIVAKKGEPILASASGVVVFSGWTYEFGNMIIIYHGDDYFTHYGHNEKNLKKQLDIVKRGDVIGFVGSSGMSTGPHLHFEIWREYLPLDPFIFFPEYLSSDLTLYNE